MTSATEIQTALVEMFAFKGFSEPVPVYRIQQRHRTRTIADTYILFLDLNGFGKIMGADPVSTTVERILDKLDALTHGVAQEFAGSGSISVIHIALHSPEPGRPSQRPNA